MLKKAGGNVKDKSMNEYNILQRKTKRFNKCNFKKNKYVLIWLTIKEEITHINKESEYNLKRIEMFKTQREYCQWV